MPMLVTVCGCTGARGRHRAPVVIDGISVRNAARLRAICSVGEVARKGAGSQGGLANCKLAMIRSSPNP
uniref:Lipoprotein n=1 Tax=Mesocestoides corti TaxID=53468 RepID=A0A5K3FR32_MESCO